MSASVGTFKAEKKDVGGGQPSPAERHAGWSGGVT